MEHNPATMEKTAVKPEKTFVKNSKEYVELVRQLWKEGQERATHSVMEAFRLEKEKIKIGRRKKLV